VLVAQRRANRLVTVFPRDHGRRLARLLPQGRFELITHSRTFIPDQPDLLVTAIEDFLADTQRERSKGWATSRPPIGCERSSAPRCSRSTCSGGPLAVLLIAQAWQRAAAAS
jgi:hypothetical protein